jgi:hypothetical protein
MFTGDTILPHAMAEMDQAAGGRLIIIYTP